MLAIIICYWLDGYSLPTFILGLLHILLHYIILNYVSAQNIFTAQSNNIHGKLNLKNGVTSTPKMNKVFSFLSKSL